MNRAVTHDWDVTPAKARRLQADLAPRLRLSDDFGAIRRVAGVDVAFPERGRCTRAAVVLLELANLAPVARACVEEPTRFPYVPGLLSFREVPAMLAALEQLPVTPDLLFCDGQGIAHPRRFGVACHLGLLTGLPAIGVAKSRLVGSHATLPPEKGARTPLMDGDERIGTVLRSRDNVRPLYISPGHRIGMDSAVEYTMRCLTRYRLPETTRAADKLAGER